MAMTSTMKKNPEAIMEYYLKYNMPSCMKQKHGFMECTLAPIATQVDQTKL